MSDFHGDSESVPQRCESCGWRGRAWECPDNGFDLICPECKGEVMEVIELGGEE